MDLSKETTRQVEEFLGCVSLGDALQFSQKDFAGAMCVL